MSKSWPEPPLGSVVRVTYTRLPYSPDTPGEQATFVAERETARWYVVGTEDGPLAWEELLATTTPGGTALVTSIDRVEVAEWRTWEPS